MQKPKTRQHYVPQSYLRRFADENDRIWTFDKVTKKSFLSNVSRVAYGRYFYDFDEESFARARARIEAAPDTELPAEAKQRLLDPQFVENDQVPMEADFAATVRELLHSVATTGTFTRDQKERMAVYITRQILRGPEFRAQHTEQLNKILTAVSQVLVGAKFGPDAADGLTVSLRDGSTAVQHGRAMYDPDLNARFVSILRDHVWHLGINTTTTPLYTSDNPVIMRSHIPGVPAAVGVPGIEINFPLTPNTVLVICDRHVFQHMAALDRKTLPLRAEHVLYFNSGQVMRSYRQVFSSVSRFELAVDVCAKHPYICQPDRERIQILGDVSSAIEAMKRGHETIIGTTNLA